jgi:hypothetical protein
MIVVNLCGGLGNQMFQYALGRNLALKNHTELKLDISQVENYDPYSSRLDVFNIPLNLASKSQLRLIRFFNKTRLPKVLPFNYNHVYEKDRHFDTSILQMKGNIVLHGYWQTENYFKDIRDTLIKEFTVKNEPNDLNKSMLEKIKNSNSVCIHVRRGDYVANKKTNAFHGTCTLDYYQNAVKSLDRKIRTPELFIFSDDSSWTQNNLQFAHPTTYVTINNSIKGYEDIRLMCNCKHFIIANSSFSWWGAWLSINPEKIICTPKRWFRNDDEGDIIPKSWIRIEG